MKPKPRKRIKGQSTQEVVEIGSNTGPKVTCTWTPDIGQETVDLLSGLGLPANDGGAAIARIRNEAVSIFARCTPPNSRRGSQIGLVVGYVQSGKTMSFTTVAALARDNGYQMVIVIAGTSMPLFQQSRERLEKDLRLNSRRDRKWQHFVNPTSESDEANIRATLEDWEDPDVPASARRTVLITVMKQHVHLDNLNSLLLRLPMMGRPVLVIDDEADQAGLNTAVRRKGESPTYRKLLGLRRLVPHHSYLQYTATPQAPLLINLIDVLSPRFVEVLTPGPDYVGGKEFFIRQRGLIRVIPENEIPSATQSISDPPDSLIEALQLFVLGVAAGMVLEGGAGNRSMLVHPSQRTDAHETYLNWVRAITQGWSTTLSLRPADPDRRELISDFRKAYRALKATAKEIPPFTAIEKQIKFAIRQTRIAEINTRVNDDTPQVSWVSAYPHILVGGQAMDRGFTVEGLTITYMPRGLGVGNADTVQQRARFFGYKRSYLGYCRVFLGSDALAAYKAYVVHEEDVRARLLEHNKSGKDLSEWKREFFLTKALKPTRHSVLGLDYMRVKAGDDWWNPSVPHATEEVIDENTVTTREFLNSLTLVPDKGHTARTLPMRHRVARGVPLAAAMESLLTKYKTVDPEDSPVYTTYLLILREHLEKQPNALCDVYSMSGGALRDRSVNKDGLIPTLFQGPHPDKGGSIYPGDRSIRGKGRVTIQVHNLRVLKAGRALHTSVPTVAIWIPKEIAPDMVVQKQRS